MFTFTNGRLRTKITTLTVHVYIYQLQFCLCPSINMKMQISHPKIKQNKEITSVIYNKLLPVHVYAGQYIRATNEMSGICAV